MPKQHKATQRAMAAKHGRCWNRQRQAAHCGKRHPEAEAQEAEEAEPRRHPHQRHGKKA